MKKTRIISLVLAVLMLIGILAGCGNKQSNSGSGKASNAKTDVNVGVIMGPPSMGLGWFMNQAQSGNTYNNFNFTVDGMDYSKITASLNDGTYDIITVPVNVAALYYNNKSLQTKAKVIDVTNLGLLYIITADKNIKSLKDLKGRNLYAIGEGATPEYTLDYVLKRNKLDKDVNVSYKSTPFEVLNLLQKEKNSVAMLPQPFVEVAKTMVKGLRVPIDISKEWEKGNKDSQAITAVTIVSTKFLEEHEQAVIEYLQMAKKSADYTNSHVEQAAKWTDDYGTFMNPAIAKQAIPYCNIVAITGNEMKTIISKFLKVIDNMDSEAIGGKMPDDDFYYIPPKGAVK